MNIYLKKAFEHLGKTQQEVINDLQKSQPYVSALMNGKKNVGKDIAKELSELYGFDYGSILTGEGSVLKNEPEPMINTNGNVFVEKDDGSYIMKETVKERLIMFLKYLKIGQNAFENKVGWSNGYISNTKEPSLTKLNNIFIEYPQINKNWLLTGEGEMLKNEPEPMINTNGNVFIEKEDGSYNVTVKLVPFNAFASYVETLNDANIVYEWEEVTFNVSQYGRGNYMAFRTKGDSMNGGSINDTPNGSLVLARELGRQHWLDGFRPSDYGWIILSKVNIFHKDITNLNKETGCITCHSRNTSPEYADFELELNDVYQIFKVIKRTF